MKGSKVTKALRAIKVLKVKGKGLNWWNPLTIILYLLTMVVVAIVGAVESVYRVSIEAFSNRGK